MMCAACASPFVCTQFFFLFSSYISLATTTKEKVHHYNWCCVADTLLYGKRMLRYVAMVNVCVRACFIIIISAHVFKKEMNKKKKTNRLWRENWKIHLLNVVYLCDLSVAYECIQNRYLVCIYAGICSCLTYLSTCIPPWFSNCSRNIVSMVWIISKEINRKREREGEKIECHR